MIRVRSGLRGTLFDGAGEPVPDGMIEIWQANPAGRYAHPADDRAGLALEEGFLGFGRCGTAPNGAFEFVTVKPGRVPWPDGGLQAPHLEVGVFARGLLKRAVTRRLLSRRGGRERGRPGALAVSTRRPGRRSSPSAENGGLRFDIRLQGPGHTTFFAV